MKQSQRMLLKLVLILICIIIFALLLIPEENNNAPQKQEEFVHIPVIMEYSNALILDNDEKGITFFYKGEKQYKAMNTAITDMQIVLREFEEKYRNQIGNLIETDGELTGVLLHEEKLCDKVLSIDDLGIEFEHEGRILFADHLKGYRLFPNLQEAMPDEIPLGLQTTDFWIHNGKIEGFVIARDEPMEEIRVLIKSSNYEGLFHESILLTSDSDYEMNYHLPVENQVQTYEAMKEIAVEKQKIPVGTRIEIKPKTNTGKVYLKNVDRAVDGYGYRGRMEIIAREEGMILINILPLEEYLFSVVPSEMPASYPMEALKAQAICARTYAYGKMQKAGYPQYGANVDDSTAFQVYGNIKENESTCEAVRETIRQLLYTKEGELARTYYYSTSCGIGTDDSIWKQEGEEAKEYLHARRIQRSDGTDALHTEKAERTVLDEEELKGVLLSENAADYEAGEPWYRWQAEVKDQNPNKLYQKLKERYETNEKLILVKHKGEYKSMEVPEFKKVYDIYVEKRGPGCVADELVIDTEKGSLKVISEYNIRYVLAAESMKVMRKGEEITYRGSLLPSGFFVMELDLKEKNVVGYTIYGGGYGHGVGMSQNAAKNMAAEGYPAEEILRFFYSECIITESKL